jgi:hypothetical protein
MNGENLQKEVKEFFDNTGLEKNDKNLEEFQKVFDYIKNGIIKNIIDDLKEEWDYAENKTQAESKDSVD